MVSRENYIMQSQNKTNQTSIHSNKISTLQKQLVPFILPTNLFLHNTPRFVWKSLISCLRGRPLLAPLGPFREGMDRCGPSPGNRCKFKAFGKPGGACTPKSDGVRPRGAEKATIYARRQRLRRLCSTLRSFGIVDGAW